MTGDRGNRESHSSQPPSILSYGSHDESRPIHIREIEKSALRQHVEVEREAFSKVGRQLYLVSFLVAAAIFVCQIVVAGCLCRPSVVIGGIWVAVLFLIQGLLGMKVLLYFTPSMLVGHAILSGFTAVIGLTGAAFVLSGQMAVICVSTFHSHDQASAIRLYVAEVTSLATSVPCLIGSVTCTISAVLSGLSAKAINRYKFMESPYIFFLQDNGLTPTHMKTEDPILPTAPTAANGTDRPPSYRQIEESFA